MARWLCSCEILLEIQCFSIFWVDILRRPGREEASPGTREPAQKLLIPGDLASKYFQNEAPELEKVEAPCPWRTESPGPGCPLALSRSAEVRARTSLPAGDSWDPLSPPRTCSPPSHSVNHSSSGLGSLDSFVTVAL